MDSNFFKNKKIFLTGNTGFKGSYLSEILLMNGADVKGYALLPNQEINLFELLNLDKKMDCIYGDIRDYEKLCAEIKRFQPDIVIHMAAQPIVRESYKNPVYTYGTNVMGTVNILECARNNDSIKAFLNVTTDKVYKNNEWNYGYRENDVLCGQDPYANSKSCSELVTHSYKESFFKDKEYPRVSTARSGNVIGGGDFQKDRIIPDAMRAYFDRKDIIIRNPNSIRPYQHVLDALTGYLLLVEKQYNDKSIAGEYNFGPDLPDCVTTKTLVETFCSKVNYKIGYKSISDNGPHEDNFLRLDNSKSKITLGWKPKWNVEESVEKTVEWIKSYENNENMELVMQKQIREYYGDK